MAQTKYALRMLFSKHYITAYIRNTTGHIETVAAAASYERPIKNYLEPTCTRDAKATKAVGDLLAMRAKVKGVPEVYVNMGKLLKKYEKEKKLMWNLINALRSHGLKVFDDSSL